MRAEVLQIVKQRSTRKPAEKSSGFRAMAHVRGASDATTDERYQNSERDKKHHCDTCYLRDWLIYWLSDSTSRSFNTANIEAHHSTRSSVSSFYSPPILTINFLKTHFNIILQSPFTVFQVDAFLIEFSTKTPYASHVFPQKASCPIYHKVPDFLSTRRPTRYVIFHIMSTQTFKAWATFILYLPAGRKAINDNFLKFNDNLLKYY